MKKPVYHLENKMHPFLIIDDELSRVKEFSSRLTDVRQVDDKRYTIYEGSYKGKGITLICTHMTAGNTAIIVDQSIDRGAKFIFKLGTFGGLQKDIAVGDVYLVSGAVRSEGLTDAYAPIYYPAVCDVPLAHRVLANANGLKIGSGIVHSVNIYAPYYAKPFSPEKYDPMLYQKLNVIGVEMETSTTYTIASVKNVPAVAVLVCNRDWSKQEAALTGKTVKWRSDEDKEKVRLAHDKVAKVVLETIATIKN